MHWITELGNRFMESPSRRTLGRGMRSLTWETLETRALRSTIYGGPENSGNAWVPAVVGWDLGNVTAAVTTTGARSTATMKPGQTGIFDVSLSISGKFLLWCRYEGTSVDLQYVGPDGAWTIPHGASGEAKVIPLTLEAGNYQLMVTAPRDSGVFIDWDLIVANGVGQTPAEFPRLVDAVQAMGPMSASGISATPPQSSSQLSAPVSVGVGVNVPGAPASALGLALVVEPTLVGRPTLDSEPTDATGPSTNPVVITMRSSEGAKAQSVNGAIVEGMGILNDPEADRAAVAGARIALVDWLASLNSRAYLNPQQGARDLTAGTGESALEASSVAAMSLADGSSADAPRDPATRDGSLVKHAGWLIPVAIVAVQRRFDPGSSRRIPKRLSSWIKSNQQLWKTPSMRPSRAGFSTWRKSTNVSWKNPTMKPRWQRDRVTNG
jgi:hypothetical protein